MIENDVQLKHFKEFVQILRRMREAMLSRLKGTPFLPAALEGYNERIERAENEIAEYEVKVARGELVKEEED